MAVVDSPLIDSAGDLWARGTTSRFLTEIGEGTLPDEALDRWLVQDRIFAGELYRFQAVALAKAPEEARAPLLLGLRGLEEELAWFEGLAAKRGLTPEPPYPVCEAYTDYLLRAAYTEPFSRLIQILFGVEVSYLQAWTSLAEAGPLPEGLFGELIERWSSAPFCDYVMSLRDLARDHPHPDAGAFARVLRLERDFWRMTREG